MTTKMLPRLKDAPLTAQGVRNLDQVPRRDRTDPMPVNVDADERALSAVGGGVLTALGLARGGCLGLGLIWTGAALMLRGATGHCPVNAVVGRNTAR
jgi:uncharacterized membrane protein